MTESNSLLTQFYNFVRDLPNAELIDELPLTEDQADAKKADVFFNSRTIVCEVKSLQSDVKGKVDAIMDSHRDRPDFPQYYNTWPIADVLAKLPDGEKLHRELFNAISAGVSDGAAEANRQIRETKRVFSLPNACGILARIIHVTDPRGSDGVGL